MASIKELAEISLGVYDEKDPTPGWYVDGEIIKNIAGFQAAVYTNNNEKIIAFCGSNGLIDWLRDNRLILLGMIPPQVKLAMKLFEMVYNKVEYINAEKFDNFKVYFKGDCYNRLPDTPTYDIMITGHSLGGALASIVANKYGARAVAFNSPGTIGLKNRYSIGGYNINIKKFTDIDNALNNMYIESEIETVLEASEISCENVCQYCTSDDLASKFKTQLGEKYIARTNYTEIPTGVSRFIHAHSVVQWTKYDRYNGSGNYDPNKNANRIIEGQKNLVDGTFELEEYIRAIMENPQD